MNHDQRRDAAKLAQTSNNSPDATRTFTGPNGLAELFETGLKHHRAGRLAEAETCYRQVLERYPDFVGAHSNLGLVLLNQGKLNEAIAAIRRAIRFKPDSAEIHSILGDALARQGKLDEAVEACRCAIGLCPGYAEAHCNLGNALIRQGKINEATAAYRRAIDIKPDFAAVHSNLGVALLKQSKLEESIAAFREAIGIKPDSALAHSNLGLALQDQGRIDEAIIAYRRAINIDPMLVGVHSNLLLCLNRDENLPADRLFAEHRRWGEQFGRQAPQPAAYVNDRKAERRLRIGYVSPDFRLHSVAYFVEPLLREHDRQAVEIFCYAEVSRPDVVTARLRTMADRWLVTVGLSDEELAERIRADRVDILVDLAGHTENNRLGVFARKPAPVQATWLGYPNTTGMDAIDYRLIDAVTDPVGEADALASETLVRLEGGFLCYGGLIDAPEPRAPPCLRSGVVTFGTFNDASKVSPITFDTWGKLLARLPKARLFVKGKQFRDDVTRSLFLARLGERGVAAERIEVVAWVPDVPSHLAAYNRVDIALDPFPYNGTTTTCEALWMGVPVVTLRGDRHAGRVGASLLSQIGLPDLIADTVEDYIEIAVALANNLARLADMRGSLRPRLAASPLCDGQAFACKIEAAYRQMWRLWRQPADNP